MSRTTNHMFKKILITAFAFAALAGTTFAQNVEWTDWNPLYNPNNIILGYHQMRVWWTGDGYFTSEARYKNVTTWPQSVEFYFVDELIGKKAYEGELSVPPGESRVASYYGHSATGSISPGWRYTVTNK